MTSNADDVVTIDREAWNDFISRLETWAAAYPADIFPEIDMLELEGGTYSQRELWAIGAQNSAGMARHILTTLLAAARKLRLDQTAKSG